MYGSAGISTWHVQVTNSHTPQGLSPMLLMTVILSDDILKQPCGVATPMTTI